mmetsp:Transcript_50713/g.130802  ORF Transcript_50713/g.130802 Transcript_50713/m.130802 type:complete len:208 (-) Transcript_50713:433-1056(-)
MRMPCSTATSQREGVGKRVERKEEEEANTRHCQPYGEATAALPLCYFREQMAKGSRQEDPSAECVREPQPAWSISTFLAPTSFSLLFLSLLFSRLEMGNDIVRFLVEPPSATHTPTLSSAVSVLARRRRLGCPPHLLHYGRKEGEKGSQHENSYPTPYLPRNEVAACIRRGVFYHLISIAMLVLVTVCVSGMLLPLAINTKYARSLL